METTGMEGVVPNSLTGTASFVSRISEYAVINRSLEQLSRVYTSSKDNSRLLRLGTTPIEYSLRLVSDTFESQLKGLDGYAGRQLERVQDAWMTTPKLTADLALTIQGLKNAEAYINYLLERLRSAIAQAGEIMDGQLEAWEEGIRERGAEAAIRVTRLREDVHREVVETLKGVVSLVNTNGWVMPIPGQEAMRRFLLSLPNRFTVKLEEEEEEDGGGSSRIVLLANDALIMIKSMINVLSYWAKP